MNKKIPYQQLVQVHEFIKSLEGLKRLMRHSWLSDGRRESVAEHTWRMAMMAVVLAEFLEEKVDLLKVLKMVLIHDIPEILAGDRVWFKESMQGKQEAEHHALKELTKGLEKGIAAEFQQLCKEFDACQTTEAKFANALDKIEVLIQHNQADISSWEDIEYEINYWYAYDKASHSQVLTFLRDLVEVETQQKIQQEVPQG